VLRLPHRVLPALALVSTGCSAAATDLVTINLADTDSVTVDSACTGDCVDTVTLQVDFAEDIAVDLSSQISIEQYKVEYAFDAMTVDFFADTTTLTLGSGETSYVDVYPASWEQQDQVYAEVGGDAVTGTATLTAAGYDWNDEVFTVSTQFSLTFEDTGAQ